jgi:hypothetical protein
MRELWFIRRRFNKMKKQPLFFHPKISWARFKKLNEGTSGDIVPNHFDRILWQGLRDRHFNIGIDFSNKSDPIFITRKKINGDMIK